MWYEVNMVQTKSSIFIRQNMCGQKNKNGVQASLDLQMGIQVINKSRLLLFLSLCTIPTKYQIQATQYIILSRQFIKIPISVIPWEIQNENWPGVFYLCNRSLQMLLLSQNIYFFWNSSRSSCGSESKKPSFFSCKECTFGVEKFLIGIPWRQSNLCLNIAIN